MQTNEFPRKVLILDSGATDALLAAGQNGYGALLSAADTASHRVLGFYDMEDMTSFQAAIPSNLNKMVIAMAYKKPANATQYNAIKRSTMNWISPEDITSITRADYAPMQNQVFDVTWTDGYLHCKEDFGIRAQFRSAHIDSIFPFGLYRSYVVKPVCNDADCNCPEVKCAATVYNLAAVINGDNEGLLSAEVGYYATAGDSSTFTAVSDLAAWEASGQTGCPVIRITFNQLTIYTNFCNPNLNAEVSDLVRGGVYAITDLQSDSISITEITPAQIEVVPTRLIKDLEWGEHNNMWYGYRNSELYDRPMSLVDDSAYYTLFAIAYDIKQDSQSHSTLRHNGITYIAVPGTFDGTTFTPGAVVTNISDVLTAIADEYNISANL